MRQTQRRLTNLIRHVRNDLTSEGDLMPPPYAVRIRTPDGWQDIAMSGPPGTFRWHVQLQLR